MNLPHLNTIPASTATDGAPTPSPGGTHSGEVRGLSAGGCRCWYPDRQARCSYKSSIDDGGTRSMRYKSSTDKFTSYYITDEQAVHICKTHAIPYSTYMQRQPKTQVKLTGPQSPWANFQSFSAAPADCCELSPLPARHM